MSSENVKGHGNEFVWDPVTKTIRPVNRSGENPSGIKIGAEDTKFFAERS